MSRTDTTAPYLRSASKVNHVLQQIPKWRMAEGQATTTISQRGPPWSEAVQCGAHDRPAALRELSDEKDTDARPGLRALSLAQQKYQAALVELRNIADEIGGTRPPAPRELQQLERCKVDAALLRQFELSAAPVHSVVGTLRERSPSRSKNRYGESGRGSRPSEPGLCKPDAQCLSGAAASPGA